MDIRQLYKRFRAWQIEPFNYDLHTEETQYCINCEQNFVGNFCPHCSQKTGMGKVSWKSVLQGLGQVWGLNDRSLVYSLWQLMFRPGYFISDYINGKRQVSFPPVKMLVVMGLFSIMVDYVFAVPPANKEFEDGSPWVNSFFVWFEANPGWGWLTIACFIIIPTWCIFRYAPRNAKHTMPQGFFIQVFMSIQVLLVDNLADLFGEVFWIMLPMCYFYAYKQLFGYGIWGNLWRVSVMLVSSFLLAVLAMSIAEFFSIGTSAKFEEDLKVIGYVASFSVIPPLVSMYISKWLAQRRERLKSNNNQYGEK